MSLKAFCKSLPKLELHAHLNGSLSDRTLQILGGRIENHGELSLDECFAIFKIAHAVTNTPENVYFAAKSVIQDFFHDGVVYLELRTTPRSEPGMSKERYVESVVKAIKDNTDDILVKLLLSIDRRNDVSSSEDTLRVIIKMKEKYPDIVKGIDLSGDPKRGSFDENLFVKARESGLQVSLHCAEVENDDEIFRMLSFQPERLGHCTALHPNYGGSHKNWELYCTLKIPAEFCLSSNVICQTSKSYEEHHVKEWTENSLPFSLNTDDKGVFHTSLSQEYLHAAETFKLTEDELWDISFRSVDHSFASSEEKERLKAKLTEWKSLNRFVKV